MNRHAVLRILRDHIESPTEKKSLSYEGKTITFHSLCAAQSSSRVEIASL